MLPQQKSRLIKLLLRLNWMEQKALVVKRYTGHEKMRALTDSQATELENQLMKMVQSADKMRKKLIWLASELEFNKPASSIDQVKNPYRLLLDNLNVWLLKKSAAKKVLNKLNPDELNHAISQLEQVQHKTYKSISNGVRASEQQAKSHRN